MSAHVHKSILELFQGFLKKFSLQFKDMANQQSTGQQSADRPQESK